MTSTRIEELSTESRASSPYGGAIPSQRLPRLSAGSTLANGRFSIRGHLGAGGMGVVYEAYDNSSEHKVALKTGHLLHPEAIYRIKGEFRALRGVQHPNLVQLHGLYAEGDLWYFTMELIEGEDFATWFASPNRTAAELCEQFAQLAAGVHAIHEAGKIHRDLKPSNIIVSPSGRLVILDYGLVADAQPGGVGQTRVDGRISGTPAYLSPEQVYGGPASEAGDWYALGVMLYQALSGDLPFSKSNPWGHLNGAKAGLLQNLRPNATPELAKLCLQLLANEPEERPGFVELQAAFGGPAMANTIHLTGTVTSSANPPRSTRGSSAYLETALHETRRGTMRVLTLSAPGEQADVEARLRELEKCGGALVLRSAHDRDESIPFNGLDGIVDELSHYLAKLPRDRAAALLPRDVCELAQLFPVLSRVDVIAEFPARLVGRGNAERRCYAALSELLSRISDRQPLVLQLTGLENADDETLALMRAMLEGEPLPVLVVLLSAPASPRLAPLLRAVKRCRWAQMQSERGSAQETRARHGARQFQGASSAA